MFGCSQTSQRLDLFSFVVHLYSNVKEFLEHQRRMRLTGCSQSTLSLASMMPSTLIDEILNDEEEDKYLTDSLLYECHELEGKNHLMNNSEYRPREKNNFFFLFVFFLSYNYCQ